MKWNSSSTGPEGGGGPGDGVDGVLVLGGEQYAHILWLTGVTGLVQRPLLSGWPRLDLAVKIESMQAVSHTGMGLAI